MSRQGDVSSVENASKNRGFFNIFRWFKKKQVPPQLDFEQLKGASVPPSPFFPLRGRLGSTDTLFSIATVSSFAFFSPSQYDLTRGINTKSSTSKISNYNSELTCEKRKKRRAPDPPSLPNTLEHKTTCDGIVYNHRRTQSESLNENSRVYVRGKKRAPPPPPPTLDASKAPNSVGRKKKPAPPPPIQKCDVINEDLDKLIGDIDRLQELTRSTVAEMGIAATSEVVSNDTLRLEGGHLLPAKPQASVTPDVTKVIIPSSPVSPRPWYKRSIRDSGGTKKESFRSLEKKKKNKENKDNEWLSEAGFSRPTSILSESVSKFNLFSKLERQHSQGDKKEEKRKSQLSMLANISELDREAAEIVKREHDQELAVQAAEDEKYYANYPSSPRRNSARELISLFNAISNNHSLESNSITSPNSRRKHPIGVSHEVEVKQANVIETKTYNREEEEPEIQSVVSTITEQTEPESSVVSTINGNEVINDIKTVWICSRCTLENQRWRMYCEACNTNRSFGRFEKVAVNRDRRKSEMNIEIDWEKELKKFFTDDEESGVKLAQDNILKKDENLDYAVNDVEELRKARLAFFTKPVETVSVQEAATKKSLDNKEKIKLKGMLKDLKNSLPKIEQSNKRKLAEKYLNDKKTRNEKQEESNKYGAVKKSTEYKTIEPTILPVPVVEQFKVVKKSHRLGKRSFKLFRAKDMADIVAAKTGTRPVLSASDNHPSRTQFSNNHVLCLKEDLFDGISVGGESVDEEFDRIFEDNIRRKGSNGSEVDRLTNQLVRPGGVAEFRANIEADPPDTNLNTLAVNRLLRRLETSIASGEHRQAAGLARELALMKINCSVIREKKPFQAIEQISVDLYVEDKVSHQGPIPLQVLPSMTVAELKIKVEKEFEVPVNVQRWILGKQLVSCDKKTLSEHGITKSGCALFLYLVAPEPEYSADKEEEIKPSAPPEQEVTLLNTTATPPPLGRGWYFNEEEDRYSYCESESGQSREMTPEINKQPTPELEDDSRTNAVKIIQRTIAAARSSSKSESPETKPKTKKFEPKPGPSKPRSVFDILNPEMNANIKKDLKVISLNSVRDTISKLQKTSSGHIAATKKDRENGTLTLGWKCPTCTLVNPPTRPGCRACATERPIHYVVPMQYRANEDELSRIRGEQMQELQMKDQTDEVPGSAHYRELLNLDNTDLVQNSEAFECSVCLTHYEPGEGVVLRECIHTFCRPCLVNTIQFSDGAEVQCPYRDDMYACDSVLQEREIKGLLSKKQYDHHLAKSMSEAENKIQNAFHCKTPDCHGWCILEDNVNQFTCPVCRKPNCLTCQAIHERVDCKQYQEQMKTASETNAEAKRTRLMLEEMVGRGEAMPCPSCQVILMKKWGCDWLRCSMCKTEICWVSRKPRWGPGGKGDVSGGCQCGINGVKCHPKCNYCH